MKGLTEALDEVTEELRIIEMHREKAISASRKIIRLSKNTIHDVHTGADPQEHLSSMKDEVMALLESCDEPYTRASGPVCDALSEYAEAAILVSLVEDGTIPDHRNLEIDAGSWLLGLADCLGELRRMVMVHLTTGDLQSAIDVFGMMEGIHEGLLLQDIPDAIVPLRRKQDIARGIMERTRSDITTATVMDRGRR